MARQIERLVIHCSDSEFGDADLIRRWHQARGWKDIGYNLVILNGRREVYSLSTKDDGRVEIGRGLNFDDVLTPEEIGSHALGYNKTSIGVCLIGKKRFTDKQMKALRAVVDLWKAIVPEIVICGHNELTAGKTCPNFDVQEWLRKG